MYLSQLSRPSWKIANELQGWTLLDKKIQHQRLVSEWFRWRANLGLLRIFAGSGKRILKKNARNCAFGAGSEQDVEFNQNSRRFVFPKASRNPMRAENSPEKYDASMFLFGDSLIRPCKCCCLVISWNDSERSQTKSIPYSKLTWAGKSQLLIGNTSFNCLCFPCHVSVQGVERIRCCHYYLIFKSIISFSNQCILLKDVRSSKAGEAKKRELKFPSCESKRTRGSVFHTDWSNEWNLGKDG